MSLDDLADQTADVLRVDDTRTDPRMGRLTPTTVQALAVPCAVYSAGAETKALGGREVVAHVYEFWFPDPVRLNSSHRLIWTDPETGARRIFTVRGTERRAAADLPDVVTAVWFETGDTDQ